MEVESYLRLVWMLPSRGVVWPQGLQSLMISWLIIPTDLCVLFDRAHTHISAIYVTYLCDGSSEPPFGM